MITEQEDWPTFIAGLRQIWEPKGTAPVVLMRPNSGFIETHPDEIKLMIDELEKLPLRSALGEPANALERLAIRLLTEGF